MAQGIVEAGAARVASAAQLAAACLAAPEGAVMGEAAWQHVQDDVVADAGRAGRECQWRHC